MKSMFALFVIALAGASTACVDEARCDAALAGVTRVRAEAAQREAQRDAQINWLRWWQTSMAVQLHAGPAGAGNDTLTRKLAALEAENAALALRLERAERRLDEAHAAAPAAQTSAQSPAQTRRLDEVVPYDLTGFLTRPRLSARREASGARPRARRLDQVVPYDLVPRDPAPSGQRILDETVPY